MSKGNLFFRVGKLPLTAVCLPNWGMWVSKVILVTLWSQLSTFLGWVLCGWTTQQLWQWCPTPITLRHHPPHTHATHTTSLCDFSQTGHLLLYWWDGCQEKTVASLHSLFITILTVSSANFEVPIQINSAVSRVGNDFDSWNQVDFISCQRKLRSFDWNLFCHRKLEFIIQSLQCNSN